MINDLTAKKMAIKFFKLYGYSGLADDVEADYCVNELFERAVQHLGKRGVGTLYHILPQQLKTYFIIELDGTNDERLWRSLSRLEANYDEIDLSERPERLKCFPEYFEKKQRVLLSYFSKGR